MRLAPATATGSAHSNAVADLLEGRGFDAAEREFLAWTEGMLTAAAIGPERTRPGAWMEAAFGRARPFESRAQAQDRMSVLAVMYNTILADLERQGSDYSPRFIEIAEDGDEIALAILWADGFLAGMQLHEEAWRKLIQSPQGEVSLPPIIAFMTQDDGKTPVMERPAGELAEIRRKALPLLGAAVTEIDGYWRAVAKRPAPSAADAFRKVGRNEPCPCGSGRKYKKCCIQ